MKRIYGEKKKFTHKKGVLEFQFAEFFGSWWFSSFVLSGRCCAVLFGFVVGCLTIHIDSFWKHKR